MQRFFRAHQLHEKPYRILAMSDSVLTNTGYATATRDIMNRLSRGYDFDPLHLAYNYSGQTLMRGTTFIDGETINFPIIGNGVKHYGEDVIEPYIKMLNTDIFWVFTDTFFLWPWFLNKNFTPAKSVFYFLSDGEGGMPAQNGVHDCHKILEKVDLPIAASKFAQRQVRSKYGMETKCIPVGVNTNKYFPLSDERRKTVRNKFNVFDINGNVLLGENILVKNFVIGSVFRNQPRKNADKLIKTAAYLLHEKKVEDFIFLLHTDPNDIAQVSDLRHLAEEFNVGHKIFFTGMAYYSGFTSNVMNDMYGCFDVFYLPTSGEGWGMPTVEAMSCEIPVLITDITTTYEQLIENGQCGEPIKLEGETTINKKDLVGYSDDIEKKHNRRYSGTSTGNWHVERGFVCVADAAEKILSYKNNPDKMKQHGKMGRVKCLKYYDYDTKIIPQWKKVLLELMEK